MQCATKRILLSAMAILLFSSIACVSTNALAYAGHNPAVSAENAKKAAAYRIRLARAAERLAAKRAKQARYERYVERKTQYYSNIFGRSVGRWFRLVDKYWPKTEHYRALYCIKWESGGNPNCNKWGLFQMMCYVDGLRDPEKNIDRAHRLWKAKGWRPWTTMTRWW